MFSKRDVSVYCFFSGTVVPAQYGGLCCLFAPMFFSFLIDCCAHTVNRFPQYSSFLLYEEFLVSRINYALVLFPIFF